jgi:heparan-alpha-glucosaminide N-acetyltransferase
MPMPDVKRGAKVITAELYGFRMRDEEVSPVPTPTVQALSPPQAAPAAKVRIASIDAFRGLVMFLMLAEAMHLWTLHDAFPDSTLWALVAFNTTHVPWQGCSLHDLIQPAFSFLAGASLPFSIASRKARGDTFGKMLFHALWRSVLLILLGIFLRSLERPQTYWTFEDTLTQIGLGYTFLFLLAFASLRVQIGVFVAILVGFWAAFVAYPLPPAGFDYPAVGVPAGWPHLYSGFLAHFNKNSNLSWAFDVWFLNLFPRESPFGFNDGGWSTLSFIPTLATMMLGTWSGMWLKTSRPVMEKLKGLVLGGVALTLAGLVLQWLHICPIVKRIWTSSYTLYSGGLVVLILAGLFAIMEVKGWKRWAFWLLVIGSNSIAIYVMSWTIEHFVSSALVRHFGTTPFLILGPAFEPVLRGAGVLVVFWLILYWMWRRKVFLRI